VRVPVFAGRTYRLPKTRGKLKKRTFMKVFFGNVYSHVAVTMAAAGILGVSSLLACDCIAPPVRDEARTSADVFTGKVVEKKELPKMMDGRRRYEVHFSVARQWKGPRSAEIVVYDAAPRGDCQGFGFEMGKEYVVFVRGRAVTADATLHVDGRDITFPDIWNDVLPIGTKILIGEICSHTSEVTKDRARQTMKLLGPARSAS
jgi:hypothetical protein